MASLQIQTHGNEYFSKDTELRQFTGSEREKFRGSFRGWKQRGRSGKSEKNPESRRTKYRNTFEKKRRQSGVVGVSMASIAAPLFLPQATWPFSRRPEVTSHFSKRAEMRCPLDRGRSRSRIENPVASAMSYVPFLMVGFLVSFETALRGEFFKYSPAGFRSILLEINAVPGQPFLVLRKSRDARNSVSPKKKQREAEEERGERRHTISISTRQTDGRSVERYLHAP